MSIGGVCLGLAAAGSRARRREQNRQMSRNRPPTPHETERDPRRSGTVQVIPPRYVAEIFCKNFVLAFKTTQSRLRPTHASDYPCELTCLRVGRRMAFLMPKVTHPKTSRRKR